MPKIKLDVKTKGKSRAVKKKMESESFKSLKHAGGAIRKTAIRSVRRRKKASSPGSAPSTRTGHLKRIIRFETDETSVDVGPTNEFEKTIWPLHEFGGTAKGKKLEDKSKLLKVGDFGPISATAAKKKRSGSSGDKVVRVKIQTQAQAARANRIQAEQFGKAAARAAADRKYPKRPFMGPALQKMRDRLPSYWKGALNR